MTTLLLTEIFPPKTGGSGRWFWEVYRRLPRDRFAVAAGEQSGQEEFDREHDLRVIRLPLKLSSWGLLGWTAMREHWRLFRSLRRIVRDNGIETLHCGKCLPEGLAALLLERWLGVPFLCYVHGEELSVSRTSRELAWWTRQVFRRARVLIANSHNTAELLRKDWQIADERIRVLHPGVDTERFIPAPRNQLVRAKLGWDNRRVVLTVGRLQKRKGQDQMIRALPIIKKTIPDILYAIVGDGEERHSLRDLTAQEQLAGHVQFLGEIGDNGLLECYQQCDLFALPNRQFGQDIEGFGMVLLEAQACGRAVLAGASGGTAETMEIPHTGQVVSCDDPQKLAAAVLELLSDPTRLDQMGVAGRKWAVDRFDWTELSWEAERIFRGGARRVCQDLESQDRNPKQIEKSKHTCSKSQDYFFDHSR